MTIPRHTWVSKLFGYDLFTEYRLGKLNTMADALSRHDEDGLVVHAPSSPIVLVYDTLRHELNIDLKLRTFTLSCRPEQRQMVGLWLMECCCLRGATLCQTHHHCGSNCSMKPMMRDMRVSRRLYIGCERPSSMPTAIGLSVISSAVARFAKGTKLSTYTRLDSYSHCLCHIMCGVTLLWILWRGFRVLAASPWCSPLWIGSPRWCILLPSVTPIFSSVHWSRLV